jgi:hypothetical protein
MTPDPEPLVDNGDNNDIGDVSDDIPFPDTGDNDIGNIGDLKIPLELTKKKEKEKILLEETLKAAIMINI